MSEFIYKAPENKNDKKFYTICIDNFFNNPDKIRNWALSLPMTASENGDWPGVRTKPLHEINKDFLNIFLLKVFSAYFDLSTQSIKWEYSDVVFQKIKKFSKNKNDKKNIGWIHQDNNNDFAGLVYLTPEINLNSGTSLYNLKKNADLLSANMQNLKESLFKNKKVSKKTYDKLILNNVNNFYEKINFSNIYNRLIAYDTQEYHRANNYFSSTEDRLTLVFFVKNITVDSYPYDRVKNNNAFDNFLEETITHK